MKWKRFHRAIRSPLLPPRAAERDGNVGERGTGSRMPAVHKVHRHDRIYCRVYIQHVLHSISGAYIQLQIAQAPPAPRATPDGAGPGGWGHGPHAHAAARTRAAARHRQATRLTGRGRDTARPEEYGRVVLVDAPHCPSAQKRQPRT